MEPSTKKPIIYYLGLIKREEIPEQSGGTYNTTVQKQWWTKNKIESTLIWEIEQFNQKERKNALNPRIGYQNTMTDEPFHSVNFYCIDCNKPMTTISLTSNYKLLNISDIPTSCPHCQRKFI